MIGTSFLFSGSIAGLLAPGDIATPTAGYSLRKLSIGYSGNVVRVREDSGNTEQDFTASEITDGTLSTFVGANNGYVTKWYDQFGSNDATQATAAAQPKIWDASTGLVTENGKPAIDFDGVDDSFAANALAGLSRLDLFFATQTTSIQYVHFNLIGALTERGFTAQDNSPSSGLPANMGTPTMYNNGTQFTGTTRDDVYTAQDGHQIISYIDADTTAFATFEIGGHGSFVFDGKFQELIAFDSDQSANRTAIESNINGYYDIY